MAAGSVGRRKFCFLPDAVTIMELGSKTPTKFLIWSLLLRRGLNPLLNKPSALSKNCLLPSAFFTQIVSIRYSPFNVVKFRMRIGYFNLQKAQNLSGGLKTVALKQRIFVGHLERASIRYCLLWYSSYYSREGN